MAESSRAIKHFSRHLFIGVKLYTERKSAKDELNEQLERMRKSIIRLSFSYSDIDRLREKLDKVIHSERKFAKFFHIEDDEMKHLKNEVAHLTQQLGLEREEKQKKIDENKLRIKQLEEKVEVIKATLNSLVMEKLKRSQRMKLLERKISADIPDFSYLKN